MIGHRDAASPKWSSSSRCLASNRHADGLEGRPFRLCVDFSAAVTSFSAAACVTSKGVPIGKARLAEMRVDSMLGRNSNLINFSGISAIADKRKPQKLR